MRSTDLLPRFKSGVVSFKVTPSTICDNAEYVQLLKSAI